MSKPLFAVTLMDGPFEHLIEMSRQYFQDEAAAKKCAKMAAIEYGAYPSAIVWTAIPDGQPGYCQSELKGHVESYYREDLQAYYDGLKGSKEGAK
jgi:hypothetical protein